MKRSILAALALIPILVLAGCGGGGGGGDDEPAYDFHGRWVVTGVVTASNVPSIPPGQLLADVLVVGQNDRVIVAYWTSLPAAVFNGTCDPEAGTFSATGFYNGIAAVLSGQGSGESNMTGTMTLGSGPYTVVFQWQGSLASRATMAQAAPPAGGVSAGHLFKALSK